MTTAARGAEPARKGVPTMITRHLTAQQTRMLAIAGGSALLLGGCVTHQPGGNQRSDDQFTYVSTAFLPVDVTLIDTRSGEEFWSVEVPVGQKLVIQFYEGRSKDASAKTPDLLRWEMYDAKRSMSPLRNEMAVPPSDLVRIDVSYRNGPEYPPENDPYAGVAVIPDPVIAPAYTPMPNVGRVGTYYRNGGVAASVMGKPEPAQAEVDPSRSGVYYTDDE